MVKQSQTKIYTATFLMCIAGLLVRGLLSKYLGHQAPFFPLVIPIVAAGRLGGFRAGLLATIVGGVFGIIFFVSPHHTLFVEGIAVQTVVMFVVSGVALAWFTDSWRSAEQRANESERYLAEVIEAVSDAVVVTAPSGRVWFVNGAASTLFQVPTPYIVGKHFDELSWLKAESEEDAPLVAHAVRNVEAILNKSFVLRSDDGRSRAVTANAVPVTNAQQDVSCVFVTIRASGREPLSSPEEILSPMPVHQSPQNYVGSSIAVDPIPVLYLDHTAKLSGGEIALVRLLTAIDRTRYKPSVLLAEDGPLVERLASLGIDTHVIPLSDRVKDVRKDTLSGNSLRRLDLVLPFARYCFSVARFIRQNRIQILHTNSLKADIYGGIAGIMTRRPIVWHIRDHIDISYLPKLAVSVFRWLARIMPSYIITNSNSTRRSLLLGARRRSTVIPSGIDARDAVIHDGLTLREIVDATMTQTRSPWHDPIRIGIVGRLAPWKGQHIFLQAAAKVLGSGVRARFLIAGSAMFGEHEYETTLKNLAANLGIEDHVEFVGFIDDVPGFMRTLDILVHASTTPEPFGQVIIEGMIEGLPVIGTDGGGVREIILNQENGLLVPIGDSESMANALLYLVNNPDDAARMARQARTYVSQSYSIQASARKVEQVYDEVISVREKRPLTRTLPS